MYSVSPDLSALWSLTSGITHEFFSDALNESGCLQNFCSADPKDVAFNCCGTWEDAGPVTPGGATKPPFDIQVIDRVVAAFERGVLGREPYCRCATSAATMEREKENRASTRG